MKERYHLALLSILGFAGCAVTLAQAQVPKGPGTGTTRESSHKQVKANQENKTAQSQLGALQAKAAAENSAAKAALPNQSALTPADNAAALKLQKNVAENAAMKVGQANRTAPEKAPPKQ